MSTRTMAPGLPLAALCLVAGLVSAGPATAQDVGQPPGLLVDIGGYRLHLYCEGESAGGPIVVLSAGGGGLAVDWAMVQEPVARSTRVCSYDRANEGFSDLGPNPRSAHQEVFELHAALQTAGEWPPYVLVVTPSVGSWCECSRTAIQPRWKERCWWSHCTKALGSAIEGSSCEFAP